MDKSCLQIHVEAGRIQLLNTRCTRQTFDRSKYKSNNNTKWFSIGTVHAQDRCVYTVDRSLVKLSLNEEARKLQSLLCYNRSLGGTNRSTVQWTELGLQYVYSTLVATVAYSACVVEDTSTLMQFQKRRPWSWVDSATETTRLCDWWHMKMSS